MLKLAALVAALAAPAFAGDTISAGGTGCQIVPVTDQERVALVTCRNVETTGAAFNEGIIEAGGVAVHVSILHRPGDEPDSFTITPLDPGLVADPGTISLDEYTTGQVMVMQWVGM